jgi:hypothetical protein
LEHYETTKSKHLLLMENARLRIRLSQISDLALEGIEESRVPRSVAGGHFVERLAARLIHESGTSDSMA